MHFAASALVLLLAVNRQVQGAPQRSRYGGFARPVAGSRLAASGDSTDQSDSPHTAVSSVVAQSDADMTAVEPPVVESDGTSIVTATTTIRTSSTSFIPASSASTPVAALSRSDTTNSTDVTDDPTSRSLSSSSSSSTNPGSNLSGKSYTGDMTWFDVGLGACGQTSKSTDKIAAIPEEIFDAHIPASGNPNQCTLCGKWITIQSKTKGPYRVQILDRCPGCSVNDLDLSRTAFDDVTDFGDGRVSGISWSFD